MSNMIAAMLEKAGNIVLFTVAVSCVALAAMIAVTSSGPAACAAPEVGRIVTDRLTGKRLMVRSVYGRSCTVVARDERGRLLSFHVAELEF